MTTVTTTAEEDVQIPKDAAAKVHESPEIEAKIETSGPCFEGPRLVRIIPKIEVKIETGGPLLEGDDIAYGDDATQPDFRTTHLYFCFYFRGLVNFGSSVFAKLSVVRSFINTVFTTGSDKEITTTAEEDAQIPKDAAAKVHESPEIEAKIEMILF
jgi:hypothetical protein